MITSHDCKSGHEAGSPDYGYLLTKLVFPLIWTRHNTGVAEWWKTCKKAGVTSTRQFKSLIQDMRDTARTERLLFQREEDSVEELDVFQEVIDEIVELQPLRDIQISD